MQKEKTARSVSAVFFTSDEGKSGQAFWYPSNASEEGSPLLCDFLNVEVIEDVDPSLNFTIARGIYSRVHGRKIATVDDYVEVLNSTDLEFHSLLGIVNQCDTLIDRTTTSAEGIAKIYFIRVDAEQALVFNLSRVAFDEETTKLTDTAQKFMKENNVREYFSQNAFGEKQTFCILVSDDQITWKHLYEGLFQGNLQGEQQQWISKSLVQQEPIDEELYQNIKGFIVTGSRYDAYDTSMPWILSAYELLNRIIYPSTDNNKKLIAICWGHQAVGHGCGGKVSRMTHKKKFQFLDEITFQEECSLSKLMPSPFYAIKCHQDHVFELPKDAKLIASSTRVEIEGMEINDRALTFQFHPEFNFTIIKKNIFSKDISQEVKDEEVQVFLDSFKTDKKASNNELNRYLKQFIAS